MNTMPNSYMLSRIIASHCCVCRTPLTDAESVDSGIGPVCSRRYYNPKHVPTADQVKIALGLVSNSDLPPDIILDFVSVVNNDHVNARQGCNLLIKFASANYDDRDTVFKCSAIMRSLGYHELADKLETDRTTVTVRLWEDKIEAYIPDHYTLERDMKKVPGCSRMFNVDGTPVKMGRKVGWVVPLNHKAYFETILGVHCGGQLMCGTEGIRTIPRKRWDDMFAFQNGQAKTNAPQSANAAIGGNVQILTSMSGRLEVYSPFNQAFIDALKKSVPKRDRVWTGYCWAVSAIFRDVIKSLVHAHYGVDVP